MHPLPQHCFPIRRWLTLCTALVALMVLIGGLTRLTESGLSIVEWKLFSGIFPPLNAQDWQQEFAAYQTTPEYQQINRGFALADFQRIFWLEYIHRVLGRVVGLALLLPFIFFSLRRMLPPRLMRRMGLACLLVAAQGGVGWVMVASGLIDQPRVDALKLALHLGLALALFSLLLWTRWQIAAAPRPAASPQGWLARGLLLLAATQIIFGALVAGLDAGYSYNSFPLMDGRFIPRGLMLNTPWWLNHLENIVMVQFQHRMTAFALILGGLALVASCYRRADTGQRRALFAMTAALALQFSLGVATLLSGMNIALASAHQMGAVLLLAALMRLAWLYPLPARGK